MRLQMPGKRRPAINVTSLIDVLVFIAYIFSRNHAIGRSNLRSKSNCPPWHTRKNAARETLYSQHIADGQMALDGQIVDQPTLRELLKQHAADIDESGGLILRADRQLSYGDVMSILDLAEVWESDGSPMPQRNPNRRIDE